MKTTIEYKDGRSETTDDVAPSIDPEINELTLVEADNAVVLEESLDAIARIVFETD